MTDALALRIPATGNLLTRPWAPAGLLLFGTATTLIGLAWDAQWHSDVGPDTFFTLPHLLLYLGSAVSGLVSLAVVLAATAATRAGRPVAATAGGRPVAVFGFFQAPAGYLVAGVGASLFLLYGLWDQWWHGLYGFDAVIESPPHVGLLISLMITMLGSVMTCAAAAGRRWAVPTLAAALVILLGFSMVVLVAVPPIGPVNGRTAAIALVSMTVLACVASFTQNRTAVLLTAAGHGVMQIVLSIFSPWAAAVYATSEGLPLRDYTEGVPTLPKMMPAALILAALVVVLRFGRSPRSLVVGGALGGAVIAATFPWQLHLFGATPTATDPTEVTVTIVVSALLGGVAGLLGDRLANALRRLALPVSAAPLAAALTEEA